MRSLQDAIHAFSTTERVVFYLFLIVAVISTLGLWSKISGKFFAIVPDFGGSISEGVMGVPRFVNPVLATSDPDKDLTSLIFSGLLKASPDGQMIDDLSASHKISDDGRTYTFVLKDNIYFHDGKPITTDDVEFTIQQVQDPTIKSPKRPIWDGITIKKIDPKQISFTLKQPYAPFLENFTIGIIPRHLWQDVPVSEFSFSQLNIEAVGSGPYMVKNVNRNSYGLPTDYSLRTFDKYALGKPFVKNFVLFFYQNEDDLIDAYKNGDIDIISGLSPANLKDIVRDNSNIITTPLPRIFGVFFNQNQASLFLNKEVREALTVAIDKDRIINEVLAGYGVAIDSPVPVANRAGGTSLASSGPSRTDQALTILSRAGWAMNEKSGVMEKKSGNSVVPLTFSMSTGDAGELKRAAELIKEDWEKIGASVELRVFEIGDLNQNVIRPRKFDALFFGEIVGREFDLYPFWHSSQRNDPGLNIALYANITADKILESIRATQNRNDRLAKAKDLENLLKTERPAAFVFSPHFIYVTPKRLKNIDISGLTYPGERFLNVNEWYIETNKVWKFFTS